MSRKKQPANAKGSILNYFKPPCINPPTLTTKPTICDLTDTADDDDDLLMLSPKRPVAPSSTLKQDNITIIDLESSSSQPSTSIPSTSSLLSTIQRRNNRSDHSSQSSSTSSQSSSRSSQQSVYSIDYSIERKPVFSSIQSSSRLFHSDAIGSSSRSINTSRPAKKQQLQPVIRPTVKRPAYGTGRPIDHSPTIPSSTTYLVDDDIVPSKPTSARRQPSRMDDDNAPLFIPARPSSQPTTTTTTPASKPIAQNVSRPFSQQLPKPSLSYNKMSTQQVDYVRPNFLNSSRFGAATAAASTASSGHAFGPYKPPSYSVAVSSEKPWETSPRPLFEKAPKGSGFGFGFGSSTKSQKTTKRSPAKTKKGTTTVKDFVSQPEYRPNLSNEQQRVLDMAVNLKHSIFFTGSAGTGKSVLMRAMISTLKSRYGEGVAVTASTGIAACNISGTTLHSFAGIGLGTEPTSRLIQTIESRKISRDRWTKTKVLIIDEISMVDATLFDKLEAIARHFCDSLKPFGGIQLIVTGDFFQLPPVKASGFAFEAQTWSQVMTKTVVLNHVFRQKDQVFVDVLNEMRIGQLSEAALTLFKSLDRPLPASKIQPAELYPLRWQVEQSNNARLQALQGEIHDFRAIDTGKDPKKMESCIAPSLIRLKKNAQVMLLKNMDSTLVNGSLGIVIGFVGEGKFTTLGSIRKRVAPNKREVTDLDLQEILTNSYPVVRFADDREIVIESDRWSMDLPDGTELANRSQIPLILAWAMSIHKSQGQTLERVKVDLGQSFEDGMAYVALSRATSLQALQIINFNPSKVTASPKVAKFYSSLQSV
ncbi:unnamed protein product [Absidia cylindrospora]